MYTVLTIIALALFIVDTWSAQPDLARAEELREKFWGPA